MGNKLIGSVGLAIEGGTPSPYTRTTSFVIACGAEDEALQQVQKLLLGYHSHLPLQKLGPV